MLNRKFHQFFLQLLALGFMLGLFITVTEIEVKPISATAATTPGSSPSLPPIGMLGFYMNTGFSLQPTDQSSFIGHPKTLTTATAHSVLATLNILGTDHFQWYQLKDTPGAKWEKVSGGTKATLTVTPTEAGTVYYQQTLQYYMGLPLLTTPTYYSKIVAFKTLDHPIDATALSVKADSNYLYNNQKIAATTSLHATPTPTDATGNITWAVDDSSLATIDSTTGVVTANKTSKNGTVKVTGTLTNEDGKPVSGTTIIEIGGGLGEQYTTAGQTATFSIKGTLDASPTTVVWHKIDLKGKDTVIANQNGLTYTTPATTMADNQTKYYATMTFPDNNGNEDTTKKNSTITTNTASLTVFPDQTPKVTMTSSLTNLTDNTGNSDLHLTNVIAGDTVRIAGTFSDSNPDSRLTKGDFSLKLPGDATDTVLLIDGERVNYGFPIPDNQGNAIIKLTDIDFSKTPTHTFQMDFMSNTVTNTPFTTQAQLTGYNGSGTKIDDYFGPNLTIDLVDGALHAAAANVDFGTLSYANVGQEITGKVAGNYLLKVTDNRRDKIRSVVTLQQTTPFSNGTHNLLASLAIKDGDESMAINNQAKTVAVGDKGQNVPSVGPLNNQNLALTLGNAAIVPGSYTSTLDWAITAAP